MLSGVVLRVFMGCDGLTGGSGGGELLGSDRTLLTEPGLRVSAAAGMCCDGCSEDFGRKEGVVGITKCFCLEVFGVSMGVQGGAGGGGREGCRGDLLGVLLGTGTHLSALIGC
jgi:hypothetical protein